MTGEGVLDPAVIDQIALESWPEARDADELHDALLTLVRLPPAEEWQSFYEELVATGRASSVVRQDAAFWVATERTDMVDDVDAVLLGWMDSIGPSTAQQLADRIGFSIRISTSHSHDSKAQGQIFRGHFRHKDGDIEWCNRRILARIHRATLGKLRREIEPVTPLDFERFLQTWQHVSPGTQLHAADGTLHVIRQLQGYEIPAAAWENDILAAASPNTIPSSWMSFASRAKSCGRAGRHIPR